MGIDAGRDLSSTYPQGNKAAKALDVKVLDGDADGCSEKRKGNGLDLQPSPGIQPGWDILHTSYSHQNASISMSHDNT
jgi:hypothetical protein